MTKSKDTHTGRDATHRPRPAGPEPAPADTPAPAPPPAAPEPEPQAADAMSRLQDQLLRLQADFDNFRKRTVREKAEVFDQANQALMLELLPVIDHLQLAIAAAAEHRADPAFRDGLSLILAQLMGVLSKFGLNPIETEGQPFDPAHCDAVRTLPSDHVPEGVVMKQVRPGYRLNTKLLRPAQVVVSSGAPAPGAPDPTG